MVHFTIFFDNSREIKDPAMPKMKQNTSRACRFNPVPVSSKNDPTPRRFIIIPATTIIARFVAKNNTTRFISQYLLILVFNFPLTNYHILYIIKPSGSIQTKI
jgi:hypothetical protein